MDKKRRMEDRGIEERGRQGDLFGLPRPVDSSFFYHVIVASFVMCCVCVLALLNERKTRRIRTALE